MAQYLPRRVNVVFRTGVVLKDALASLESAGFPLREKADVDEALRPFGDTPGLPIRLQVQVDVGAEAAAVESISVLEEVEICARAERLIQPSEPGRPQRT